MSSMEAALTQSILIFTDGACSGNPGPGGWGAIIVTPKGQVKELGGGSDQTTNNQMEMTATINALQEVKNEMGPVYFYTDSTYVIRGITQWVWGWRKNGWKTAEGAEVLNKDLWQRLFSLVMDRGSEGKVHWRYSRGHVGTPGNERCDEIAVSFSKKQWIELFEGSLLKYAVAVYDVPENSDLPEMRPKQEKKQALCYLSVVGGVLVRHSDWASCERRVKGQSGAKFKKAMSEQEVQQIITEWGLNGNQK